MTFTIPKDFIRVSPEKFRWFLRALGGTQKKWASGVGYYDKDGTLVALETGGQHYVKP